MNICLKHAALAFVFIIALALSLPNSALAGEDVPLVDGTLWTESSPVEKKSYVIGMANLMVVEYLYQEGSKQMPSDDQTIIQRLYDATEDVTLDGIIDLIDQWYKNHPGQLKEPVIVVIWNEFVKN